LLYFVPTPIGNLGDISHRALEILRDCEIIFAEDTRISKKLLNLLSEKFDINFTQKSFFSVHSHNEKEFIASFDAQILHEKICVFMSDAGMPCISDPGINFVKFALINSVPYEILPGANAILLAVAASGIVEKEFIFLGFLPNSGKEREIAIQNALNLPYPAVIYESPKRILEFVEKIAKFDENREIFLIKEATKKFEMKFFGTAAVVLNSLKTANLNGEWAAVIQKNANQTQERITEAEIIALDIPPKAKAKLIAKITGISPKKIYEKLTK